MEKQASILVVDDEPHIRDACQRMLTDRGYRVGTTADGEGGIEAARTGDFDLLLVDIKMPGMSGIELVRLVQEFDPAIVCVMITGYAAIDTAVEATKSGAFDFLAKPFTTDVLLSTVKRGLEHRLLVLESRRLREERERSLLEISAERSRLRTVINCIQDGVLVTDLEGRLVLNNPAAMTMLKLSGPGPVDQPLMRCIAVPELADMVSSLLVAGDDADTMLMREIKGPDGERALMAIAAPVKDERSETLGVVTVVRDITAYKQHDLIKSQFVAMVAHELKTPLAAIQGYISVLLSGAAGDDPKQWSRILMRSNDRARALVSLIDDLLDISSIEAGRIARRTEILLMRDIVQDAMEIVRSKAETRAISLTEDLPGDLPPVRADREDMGRLFINLLTNAIKYNRDGGSVRLSGAVSDDYLRIDVTDTGLGIPEDSIPQLFGEFYRVKTPQTREITGTGLGLSIVKKIVQAHHGHVNVESLLGSGSTFSVFLPIADYSSETVRRDSSLREREVKFSDIREQFAMLDLWPFSALDKKRKIVAITPCGDADLDSLSRMYETYEPKAAIQGLPPIAHNTRIEWIRSSLQGSMNLKVELGDDVIAHGMLFPMPDPAVVEFSIFVHNRVQNRGIGRIVANLLFVAAKRLGYKKVWTFEIRNNPRAIRIYHEAGFRVSHRALNELELELDLTNVTETLDLSDIITPTSTSKGHITSPDYLSGQCVLPDTRSVVIYSPRFEEFTLSSDHPFITARSRLFLDMCKHHDLLRLPSMQIMEPRPIDEDSVLAFHSSNYYYYLMLASRGIFDPPMISYGIGTDDNPVAFGLIEYSMLAAGATVMGADLLISHPNIDLVFSPTGGFHHAGPQFAAGFCYINDIVIAIKYLLQHECRVLYFDIDAHHGDGVQFAFYDEPRVLKISLHESARTLFPWNSGFENELGEGPGYGYNVNVPLAPGTEDEIYREVFHRIVSPLTRAYKPDICIVAAGVDTMYSDPLSHLSLTNNIFAEVIHDIRQLVPKMLICGAGGYNPINISGDWALAWAVLHDIEPDSNNFGQMGSRDATAIKGTSLRDAYPYISVTKIAEARAEACRVMTYLEEQALPIHGITHNHSIFPDTFPALVISDPLQLI